MIEKLVRKLLIFIVLILFITPAIQAQISSNADAIANTDYAGRGSQDPIFIFCTNKEELKANLTATTILNGTINYEWQKYDSVSGTFQLYSSQPDGGSSNRISMLEDGAYRAVISNGSETEIFTAWVFNNYYEVSAEITESNCDYFQLEGNFATPTLIYYDLSTNQAKEIEKNTKTQWTSGGGNIASYISPKIYTPPTTDTEYTLVLSDGFGCGGNSSVMYNSIVTKASFSVSKQTGEAPLEVVFTNNSENGTSSHYEWFFFKALERINEEADNTSSEIDSIDFMAYNDDLTYKYEKSGTYMVKLVSKHISDLHTCVDTFYLEDYIEADTSFVKAPNFFTPNGDGSNDRFVVKFWSVKNIKISIFNRWGKKVHYWESSNVQGFENSVNSITESVWDGTIGGTMASPGVYYYVVEARGRDDENRRAHGFVHLFRGKQ